MDLEKTVINAMARALFVSAFADQEEEAGRHAKPGQDWMDLAPRTPQDAVFSAFRLTGAIEQASDASILALLQAARRCDGFGETSADAKYARDFGHNLAMEALGHGVSWKDDHEPVVICGREMVIPLFEYTIDPPEPETNCTP